MALTDFDKFDDDLRVIGTKVRVSRDRFCRRLYTCESCGHETPTLGWPLPEPATCFMWVDRGLCRGRLRYEYT